MYNFVKGRPGERDLEYSGDWIVFSLAGGVWKVNSDSGTKVGNSNLTSGCLTQRRLLQSDGYPVIYVFSE
jgi:hypothetical protein